MRAAHLIGVTNRNSGDDATDAGPDMQSILDLIHESGFEWPESLYGMNGDMNNEWNI